MNEDISKTISEGQAILGIELGSTRIKAVLIDAAHRVLASGSYTWENRWEDGYWTYSLDAAKEGVRAAYSALAQDVLVRYGVKVEHLAAMGVSGMMHGYLPLDADGRQLAPFRTWRSTTSARAAEILSREFDFNVPIRWSVAHLYQAVLDNQPEVPQIAGLTTLAGWVHTQLTGKFVLGVCEASGMFPIDPQTKTYDSRMVAAFQRLTKLDVMKIFPSVRLAGEDAGALTAEGAAWIDPTGTLKPGVPMAPPEGDAGTGMVATDSTAPGTGNVSAGTSVFAMVVLEKALSRAYPEVDVVMTPMGDPVAMVHCNNGTSDIDAWMNVLSDVARTMGAQFTTSELYERLFRRALDGDSRCGGVTVCNFVSAEPLAGQDVACPSVTRCEGATFDLPNFMRAQLVAVSRTLAQGLDILTKGEGVKIAQLTGHGGYFKVPEVGARIMSETLGVPVVTRETAGEGGAWGIAVLAEMCVKGM